ncbi:MAG TPA: hypothetical protein PKK99_13755, partial [Bacteroidia bacterium]|nr:hypothetical protein [Bacteroidia bacterium]
AVQCGVTITYAPFITCSTPNANAGPDKILTCSTPTLQLSGSSTTSNVTYAWSASGGGNISSGATTATPTVTSAGTYTLTVTTASGGCTATDIAVVSSNMTAPAANAGQDVAFCAGGNAALGAASVSGNSYAWIPSGGLSNNAISNPSVSSSIAGTTVYTLTVTNTANGCSAVDLVSVTVNALPTVNAGSYNPACGDASPISLSGSPAGGIFSGDGISGSTFDPVSAGPGSHVITYQFTDANNCSNSATTNILVNAPPIANAGNDSVVTCPDPIAGLNGSSNIPNAHYAWTSFDGGTFDSGENTATPQINGEGTFVLTVTDPTNGCTARDTAVVTRVQCIFPYYPPPDGGKVYDVIGAELNSLFHNFGSINTSANDIFVLDQDSVYIEVIARDGQYATLLSMLTSPQYGMVDLIDNSNNTLIISGKFPVAHLLSLDSLPIVQYIDYARPLFPAITNVGVYNT